MVQMAPNVGCFGMTMGIANDLEIELRLPMMRAANIGG